MHHQPPISLSSLSGVCVVHWPGQEPLAFDATWKGRSVVAESLLPRVASGDQAAVRECLDRYGGLVWSLARRFFGQTPDAEDAVQETFIDVWRSAGRYDPRCGTEANFIMTVARRRFIDRRRRSERRPAAQPLLEHLPSEGAQAQQQVELEEEAARALQAFAELRHDQRRVLELALCHGMSHDEIARSTGLPLGTVKTHVRRGLIRVRQELSTDGSRLPRSSSRPSSTQEEGV